VNTVLACSIFHVLFQCTLCIGILWLLSRRPVPAAPYSASVSVAGIPELIFLSSFFLFLCYVAYVAFLEVPGALINAGERELFGEFAYMASFLKGVNSRRSLFTGLLLPIASGITASTEYLPPLYAALLQSCGISSQCAIFIQTVMLDLAIVFLQYSLAHRFGKSQLASCLSVPVVFLLSGFGFLRYLSGRNRLDPGVDYVFFLGSGRFNAWGHHLLHCLLTSRASLLSMALSLLSYCSLDGDSFVVSGLIGLAIILIRSQTGFAFFLCFFLFKWRGLLRRLPFIVPAIVLFIITRLSPSFTSPIWMDRAYANAMFPSLAFLFAVFGLLLPALLLIAVTPSLIPRAIAPAVSFSLLAFLRLQPDIRLNFHALVPTTIPLFVTLVFAAIAAFRDRWQSDDVRGLVNCALLFATFFMCLSSLTGLSACGHQKFTAWDSYAIDLGKWVQKNTPLEAVFASSMSPAWNPAVVIAGRCAYYPTVAALQTGEYDARMRAQLFNAFLFLNETLEAVHYYVVEKKTKVASVMAAKVGVFLNLVYENTKFQLLRTRL
jgi:hypothetical protein